MKTITLISDHKDRKDVIISFHNNEPFMIHSNSLLPEERNLGIKISRSQLILMGIQKVVIYYDNKSMTRYLFEY